MSLNHQTRLGNVTGSEMAALMNAVDWQETAVGPIDSWPNSLKTAVDICLGSKFPMVIWWGPDYTMIYNDAYRPMLGSSKHPQYLGRSGQDCWSEIWHILEPMMKAVFATGQATWSENFLLHMERNNYIEETYFTFSYSPLLDDQGAVHGIFNACTETTRQVLGERRLKTLHSLIIDCKSTQEAGVQAVKKMAENPWDIPFARLYLADECGNALTLAGSFGFRQEEPGGAVDLTSPVTPLARQLRRVFYAGKAELINQLPDLFPASPPGPWTIPPRAALMLPVACQGKERLSAILILGISPCLSFDDDYKSFFDLVAGHIGTVIATAQAYEEECKMVAALAELNRAKSDFISNISHEFRTPLTLMLSPLEELIQQHAGTLPGRFREQLRIIERNGLRLLKLVNTLLDFSQLEVQRIKANYEPTDLAAFTRNLASEFRALIENADLVFTVECQPCPQAWIDRDIWEKIVLNLLSNAFKYTFAGEIKVSLTVTKGQIKLTVADSGIGIDPKYHQQIFERFHRVQGGKARTHEGSGIGLALVKELVMLHGGTIAVASEPGQGSTFTVEIPYHNKHKPLPNGRSQPLRLNMPDRGSKAYVEEARCWLNGKAVNTSPQLAGPRGQTPAAAAAASATADKVLIIDDNQDMLYYLQSILNPHWHVFTANNGLSGLTTARSVQPDLILTDVMMPELDGFQVVQEIRRDLLLKNTPVIMLSARADNLAKLDGFEAGADDYLIKPFSAKELVARVRANLQLAKMRNNIDELKRKEIILKQSEQRFSQAFHNNICMMALIDFASARYIDVNLRFADAIGYQRAELIGQAVSEPGLVNGGNLTHILDSLSRSNYLSNCEIKIKTKAGEMRDFYLSGELITIGRQQCIMLIAIDVTEKKLYLDEMGKLERLNMVGQMAAGISHEIRNPLTTVKGYLQLFEKKQLFQPYKEQFDLMIEELDRASSIITEFLSLAKNKLVHQETCNLNEIVASIAPLIEAGAMLENKTVNLDLRSGTAIFADPKEIRQLIINLAKNGLEAMGEYGLLSMTTYDEEGCPVLAITDTGCGIPAEMLEKLGTPFVTTKAHGTGLGLPICYSIVDRNQARIEVDSQAGGTEFRVFFTPG